MLWYFWWIFLILISKIHSITTLENDPWSILWGFDVATAFLSVGLIFCFFTKKPFNIPVFERNNDNGLVCYTDMRGWQHRFFLDKVQFKTSLFRLIIIGEEQKIKVWRRLFDDADIISLLEAPGSVQSGTDLKE